MTDHAAVQQVIFHRPKAGRPENEWEDGAGHDSGDPSTGRPARCVVVDGATEAFDSRRWAHQLVTHFLGDDEPPPALTVNGLDRWFAAMQQRWVDETPSSFSGIFEEYAFHRTGSFATFLGCEIHGLGGPSPRWTAAALGDAVLFVVRDGLPVAQHPRLSASDFGLNPAGVSTLAAARDRMRSGLALAAGDLCIGDTMFLVTDAFGAWLTARARHNGLWRHLAELEHPREFHRLVAAERNERRMKDDDVTMLRVQITAADADVLVVCR